MLDLSKISFGAPAAERDIGAGLIEYFFESDAFRRIASRQKTILIGNRGTGKSAIFKILAERGRKSAAIVIELSPENYSYEMLRTVLKKEDDGAWAKHGAFASAWKYLIYVLIMKAIVQEGNRFKAGSSAKIYEYLRDHHKGSQDNLISILVSYLKRIEGLKIGPYEAAAKTRELSQLYKLQEIEPLMPHLLELTRKRKVIVLVDELDKGWDSSEDAKAFVSGLFQASVSLNERDPNLTVYISLRQELYESIPAIYDDAQKYRDIIEKIQWDEPSLLAMVAKRMRFSMPSLKNFDDEECWNALFAETLQYRKARSFNYMIDRTLYRPREIIQFCTEVLEKGRADNVQPFNYSVISSAEQIYSSDRVKDIEAEYRFQFPGLHGIFEVFRGRAFTMSRTELDDICLSICTGELKTGVEAGWVVNQDPEYLIEILWRVGFLRAYAVGGLKAMRRSGSSYIGPHQVSNLNLQSIGRFHVHPMFRASLGMKEAKGDSEDE